MNPQAPSRTALASALMRALHTRSAPLPILDDPWADRLLPAQALSLAYRMIRGRAPDLGPLGYQLLGNPSDLELLRRYDPDGESGLVVAHDVNRIAHLRGVTAGEA